MSAVRAIERIRPRIPLIKFRFVKGQTGSVSVGASKAKSNLTTSDVSTRREHSVDFTALPRKYRRLALTPQELEYINRGGPD